MTQSQERKMDTGEAVEQGWSDDIMRERWRSAFGGNPTVHQWGFLCWVRDAMQATIATQAARIAELTKWKKTATNDLQMAIEANRSQQFIIRNEREHVERLAAELATLRQELAAAQIASVPDGVFEAWEVVRDLVIIAEDAEEYECLALNDLCHWFRDMKGATDEGQQTITR